MAQTAAKRITSRGDSIDYTPASAVLNGDVVEIGSIPLVATQAIAASVLGALACEGVFDVPKTSDVFTIGDAVYWNSSGTPVTGDASSGAGDNATGNLMGVCVSNANAALSYVRTKLTAAKRTTTIGGAVTASGITSEDSSLGITGLNSATTGGGVAIAGALGNAAGVGGPVTVTGGIGGATGAGGAVTIAGGGGGAAGDGGALSLASGAGGAASGDGGGLTIAGGAATNNNDNGGGVTINGGAKHGTGADGAITIGSTAASITLGKMPLIPCATVAASGANQADAIANAPVAYGVTLVSAADNAKGIALPTAVAGAQCIIINDNTAKTLLVYPGTADIINSLGANNVITMGANAAALFVAYNATQWYSVPRVPS